MDTKKTAQKMKNRMIYLNTKVFTSLQGWAISSASGLLAFFATEKYSFYIVLFAVLADAFFGTWASIARGKFVLSKLGRDTMVKLTSYGAALAMVFMVEKLAHEGGFIGVKVAAAWAIACEFWSMSGSILILWPDAPFFRIMRRQLKGEISSKLGRDVDDILTE